ncbi:PilN domain-containing protein [Candidatus Gottesmanbacteria bacterium]|nr:PilN domain-containing protein [Candidatus Gottesmanbacteria bacterium]
MPAQKKQVNINLIERPDENNSLSNQFLSWAFTYGRYIIIITQIIVLSVFFLRFKFDREHADLKESVSQKQAILESVKDLENEINGLQNKLSDIRKIVTSQEIPVNLLRFLQENSPTDTSYSNINFTSNQITFTASTNSLKSFSILLKNIQSQDKFSEVNLEDIQRRKNGRIEFKISAKVNINKFS